MMDVFSDPQYHLFRLATGQGSIQEEIKGEEGIALYTDSRIDD
jgi:hypothetical protein